MPRDLIRRVASLGRPRVLVVGDLVLGREILGESGQTCPETGVPRLRADRREHRLGGAAAVASALAHLGADVRLLGALGRDSEAVIARKLLAERGIDDRLVVPLDDRPTTLTERFLGQDPGQDGPPCPRLRVDHETRDPIPAEAESHLWQHLPEAVAGSDLVVVSDQGLGVCTPTLLRSLVTACRSLEVRVVADPARADDLEKFEGVHALRPGRIEAGRASGIAVRSADDALEAARALLRAAKAECVLVDLGAGGLVLAQADGPGRVEAGTPLEVTDPVGAADAVLAAFALALAAGSGYDEAAALSAAAAGLALARRGDPRVTRADLLRTLLERLAASRPKLMGRDELTAEVAWRRAAGQSVAFTRGCFDLLHRGHVRLLHEAAVLGQFLVVGLRSDASVLRIKGHGRPIQPEDERAEVLAALGCVGAVTVFDEDTPLELIDLLAPDVLVTGEAERAGELVGRVEVEAAGGRLVFIPRLAGHSTTRLVHRASGRKLTLHAPETPEPVGPRPHSPADRNPRA